MFLCCGVRRPHYFGNTMRFSNVPWMCVSLLLAAANVASQGWVWYNQTCASGHLPSCSADFYYKCLCQCPAPDTYCVTRLCSSCNRECPSSCRSCIYLCLTPTPTLAPTPTPARTVSHSCSAKLSPSLVTLSSWTQSVSRSLSNSISDTATKSPRTLSVTPWSSQTHGKVSVLKSLSHAATPSRTVAAESHTVPEQLTPTWSETQSHTLIGATPVGVPIAIAAIRQSPIVALVALSCVGVGVASSVVLGNAALAAVSGGVCRGLNPTQNPAFVSSR